MSLPNAPYSVVWPRSELTVAFKPMAKRLDTLSDKTIAFCWDYVFRGDEIWGILKEQLSARYPGVKFIDNDVFGSTHGGDEHQIIAALPGKLKSLGVDAVVSGVGA
jgi:hypothetical protein